MVEFKVAGMTCDGCVRSITNAVHGVAAAAKVTVDLRSKRVSVETNVDAGAIADAIENAGHQVERQNA